MMGLFGKKKAKPKVGVNESISTLREAMDSLEKREKHLERQMAEALKTARVKSKSGDKRGALFQLKRKKMFEKEINGIYNKRTNLEMQINTLEAATGNKELVDAMKSGSSALKNVMSEADIDNVDDVMADINEQMDLVDEMNSALGQEIGQVTDDADLEAELEGLEEQMMEETMLDIPESTNLSSLKTEEKSFDALDDVEVPSGPIKSKSRGETAAEKEERELKELEAELF
eukprot:26159_1